MSAAAATQVPAEWVSVLPHLGYRLPEDRTPQDSQAAQVTVNLPLSLVRQSILPTGRWPIPGPVLQGYRRYRPTPLWRARGFEEAIGARVPVYVKYEGGNISGSHKLNTALAQVHYYQAAGVRELATGTGAGQWGTALAAACGGSGLRCTVFMVGGSLAAKPYRGSLMRLLGATVIPSPSGLTTVGKRAREQRPGGGLALAIGEAIEYAAGRQGCAFATGSGETYSIIHQSVIGQEAIAQLQELDADVDTIIGPVGAGSSFGGTALPFLVHAKTAGLPCPRLLAAESSACPKLTHGVYAFDHTDATRAGPLEAMYTVGSDYQIPDMHAAGLRYHGAAKLISAMRYHGQIAAIAVGQQEALRAGQTFARSEAVLTAPETGHALAAAARLAAGGLGAGRRSQGVLVCLSGQGYLDLSAYDEYLAGRLDDAPPSDELIRAATEGLQPVHPEQIPQHAAS